MLCPECNVEFIPSANTHLIEIDYRELSPQNLSDHLNKYNVSSELRLPSCLKYAKMYENQQ